MVVLGLNGDRWFGHGGTYYRGGCDYAVAEFIKPIVKHIIENEEHLASETTKFA